MPMEKEKIKKLIKNFIPDADILIEDLRGDGDHYSATIISKSFKGKSKIEQHKMVYESLQGKMGNELHALMLKTKSE
jgi:stress-induced morphogen